MTELGSSDTPERANAGKDSILLANQKHRQEMFDLIESGEAIAFVGAGLSHPVYPTWQEFLGTLANKAVELTDKSISLGEGLRESDVLDYAEAIKRHFIRRFCYDTEFCCVWMPTR
jgi:hypothetical protein